MNETIEKLSAVLDGIPTKTFYTGGVKFTWLLPHEIPLDFIKKIYNTIPPFYCVTTLKMEEEFECWYLKLELDYKNI